MRANKQLKKTERIKKAYDFWPYTELFLGLVLGLILYLIKQPVLANITLILGPALSGSRMLLTKKIEEELAPVKSLALVVDLERQIDDPELLDFVRSYNEVVTEDFHPLRTHLVHKSTKLLKQYAREERSEELATGAYYQWLLPKLEKTQRGDRVWAVSMMMDCEWDSSPSEERFLEENMSAVERGVILERVFVTKYSQLAEMLANKGVQAHSYKSDSNLRSFVVFEEDLHKKDPELLREIKDGFIAFNDKVVLIDVSSEEGMRGFFVQKTAEIRSYARMFDRLKNLARPLNHPSICARDQGSLNQRLADSAAPPEVPQLEQVDQQP
ncbi:MAG: hypothetical protein KF884_10885 [Fimbriimonadaceae bacterium]|nr:hypothetical protein [Fimbriimonadaceae bacterium]QYK58052.1 MAG: hypothetical protein KF884_10885 [Fimbriimonadaceae bacterium]